MGDLGWEWSWGRKGEGFRRCAIGRGDEEAGEFELGVADSGFGSGSLCEGSWGASSTVLYVGVERYAVVKMYCVLMAVLIGINSEDCCNSLPELPVWPAPRDGPAYRHRYPTAGSSITRIS